MAFYRVSRTDVVEPGEYDAAIVRASGKVQALRAVTGAGAAEGDFSPFAGFLPDGSNASVRKLVDGRNEPNAVLLASYIA
jgi:hypothetical protein